MCGDWTGQERSSRVRTRGRVGSTGGRAGNTSYHLDTTGDHAGKPSYHLGPTGYHAGTTGARTVRWIAG